MNHNTFALLYYDKQWNLIICLVNINSFFRCFQLAIYVRKNTVILGLEQKKLTANDEMEKLFVFDVYCKKQIWYFAKWKVSSQRNQWLGRIL